MVAAEGNMTRAARALHLTQPALSRSIASLEAELGAALFVRRSTGVALTPTGSAVLSLTTKALSDTERHIDAIRSVARGESGTVHAALGPTLLGPEVSSALLEVQSTYPRIELSLDSSGDVSDQKRRLIEGQFDFYIAMDLGGQSNRGLNLEPLGSRKPVIFLREGHPLAGRSYLTLSDIERYPIAASLAWNLVIGRLDSEADRLRLRATISADHLETLWEVARQSDSLVPGVVHHRPPGLVGVELSPDIQRSLLSELVIYTPADRSMSAATASVLAVFRRRLREWLEFLAVDKAAGS